MNILTRSKFQPTEFTQEQVSITK